MKRIKTSVIVAIVISIGMSTIHYAKNDVIASINSEVFATIIPSQEVVNITSSPDWSSVAPTTKSDLPSNNVPTPTPFASPVPDMPIPGGGNNVYAILEKKQLKVKVGKKKKITIKKITNGGYSTSNPKRIKKWVSNEGNLLFRSKKPKIASVNAKGVVKAKRIGTSKIIVRWKKPNTKRSHRFVRPNYCTVRVLRQKKT